VSEVCGHCKLPQASWDAYLNHERGCLCEGCIGHCFALTPGSDCDGSSVDWRKRARTAEAYLKSSQENFSKLVETNAEILKTNEDLHRENVELLSMAAKQQKLYLAANRERMELGMQLGSN
jgi:hypothetical protein